MSEHQSNQAMNSLICPRCGTINPANAMNCQSCRINLDFAFKNPDVVKGITPPDLEPQVVQEFNPSKFRYFLWMAGGLMFVILIIQSINFVTGGSIALDWLGGVLGAATVLVIQTLVKFRNYKVVIMADGLLGPSASAINTVTFKFEQIDWHKTSQRSIWERLEGSTSVYSLDRKRILLSGLVYDPKQIQAILKNIGYDAG